MNNLDRSTLHKTQKGRHKSILHLNKLILIAPVYAKLKMVDLDLICTKRYTIVQFKLESKEFIA